MTIAQALPQYDWRYSVDEGYYLDLVNPLGVVIRYRPTPIYNPDSVPIVRRDVETLLRRLTTFPYLRSPPQLSAGATLRVSP